MKLFPRVLLFSIVFTLGLHALSLKANYYTPTKEIYLHTIIKDAKTNPLLYSITEGRYTKKISSKKLLKKLYSLGYDIKKYDASYVKFTHEIAFDRKRFKTFLTKIYTNHYKDIDIKKITIHSRGYLKSLPQNYTFKIKSNAHLKNHGILSIKSNKKEFYFDYEIVAFVGVYKAKERIKRNSELSAFNVVKTKLKLTRFLSTPLYITKEKRFEAKHIIKKDSIITKRDVILERLVRRGNSIKVTLNENNLAISFEAKALSDAIYGDTIKVKQSNNRVIQVKVVGKNRAEVF